MNYIVGYKIKGIYSKVFFNINHNITGVVMVDMFKIWQPNVSTATNVQGPDHVISTGHQMTNLVLNFEYLSLLCFLTTAEF